jgi:hypothetical protein
VKALLSKIYQFVEYQTQLLGKLRSDFPESKDDKFLLDFPKFGTIEVNGVNWEFKRHGVGIRFDKCTNGIVDIETKIDSPSFFNASRLSEYARSTGGRATEKEMQLELESLAHEGAIESMSNGYFRIRHN